MPNVVWDPETLARLHSDAEVEFSVEFPCILDRLSLAVVASTADYSLPDYVHSIKRITHKGIKLEPMPLRVQRQAFQSATQSSKSFWYIFNNVAQNKISLFPIPNASIAAATGDLWSAANISASFIIEYYRIADGISYLVPLYFRRRLLKCYVAKQAFLMESRGQKIKNADYFEEKWVGLKGIYNNLLFELHNKPRKLIISGGISSGYFPGRPVLPIDRYGPSVDAGE